MMNKTKAIFFDLDNVLVFSEILHFKAWQQVIQRFGKDLPANDFHHMIGISDLVQSKLFIEKFTLEKDPHDLWELKRQTFIDITEQGFDSPDGRDAFLEKIAKSYTLGLVSSSSNRVINHILQVENIGHYFNFIIGHEDCEKHKPDPYPYQKALKLAQVEPHQALVIEDSMAGIRAAQAAAIPVIGIFKDQTHDQLFSEVAYFNDFVEVDKWFKVTEQTALNI